MKLEIRKGSVVYAPCDCIVNAANEYLQYGGGVCGAIFEACGVNELQKECNTYGRIKSGNAVMTNGYKLSPKKIIHAVGPIYTGRPNDNEVLKNAYVNSLILADNKKMKSIAFPSISTGIFGFPLDKAVVIAINAILSYKPSSLENCYIYCFTDKEFSVFLSAYEKIRNQQKN